MLVNQTTCRPIFTAEIAFHQALEIRINFFFLIFLAGYLIKPMAAAPPGEGEARGVRGEKKVVQFTEDEKAIPVPLQRTRKLDTASTHQKNVPNKSQKKRI